MFFNWINEVIKFGTFAFKKIKVYNQLFYGHKNGCNDRYSSSHFSLLVVRWISKCSVCAKNGGEFSM